MPAARPARPVIGGWHGHRPDSVYAAAGERSSIQRMAMTISDSTLANFQDAAVFTHPDSGNALYRDFTGQTGNATDPAILRSGLKGQAGRPVHVQRHDLQHHGQPAVEPVRRWRAGQLGEHRRHQRRKPDDGDDPQLDVLPDQPSPSEPRRLRSTARTRFPTSTCW